MAESVTTLKYMTRFQCLGGDCEDTCCAAWNIVIAQDDYERIREAVGETRTQEALVRIKEPDPVDNRYATLAKKANGNCTFLSTTRSCNLQTEHGETVLPNLCSMFPRRAHRVAGNIELSATPGCPEISRLLLLAPDAVEVIETDAAILPRPYMRTISTVDDENLHKRHMDDMRAVLLDLLMTEEVSIDEAFFLMAYFAHKVKESYVPGCGEAELLKISDEVTFISRKEVQQELIGQYRSLDSDMNAALAIGSAILETAAANSTAQGFRRLTMEVLAGITKLDESEFFRLYSSTRQKLHERAGARIEQYFFNYCVNYLIFNAPCDDENLLVYLERFFLTKALIQLLLFCHPVLQAAIALPDDELETTLDDHAVRIFYLVTRATQHSQLLKALQETLKQDIDRFALTTMLIRL
jgi:lysine-N-methylase